jgi:hypothetical protein
MPIFTGRADIEQVSDVPNRNSKTNTFKNRRAEFRGNANLGKEECNEVITPIK